MTWQIAVILQVLIGASAAMYTRHLMLTTKRVFFGLGVATFFVIALTGFIMSLVHNQGLPSLPPPNAWLYLVIQGLCIPTASLIQFKIIGYIGAGNAVTVSTLNMVCAALLGILFLNEGWSAGFIMAAFLIIASTVIVLRIHPDLKHRSPAPLGVMVALILSGALLFAIGMYFEKVAVDTIGVWDYYAYGWVMQLAGVTVLFCLFGRKELKYLSLRIIRNGLLLGFITCLAGILYIYALSVGSLSATIIATSGKVAVTALLAAIILKERNHLWLRVAAFILSMIGLWLVVY